jgi:quercetin dioxygenase-like cupin family protein
MFKKVEKISEVPSEKAPFPGYTGDVTIKVLSADYALGPLMLHLRMEPGSSIPAHLHKKATEVLCVLDGDFINENVPYGPGDFMHSTPGMVHGPHRTKNGCTVLVLWTAAGEADPNDFYLAEASKA